MKRLLLAFIIVAGNLIAQVYNFHYYNSTNGLTSTSITSIAQDYQGYIWIGTSSNVFRYDGYNFEEIGSYNSNLRTEITGIAKLKDQVWISTSSKGIFVINSKKEVIHLNDRLPFLPDKIKVLKEENNRLLFISQQNEFFAAQSDSQVSKILVDALLPQTNFNDIISIDNGYAIASDDGLIIFQYNRVKYKFNQNKTGKPIIAKTLTLDRNKNIVFVDSKRNIYRIENFNLSEIFNSNKDYNHFSLLVDKSNSIWVGCDEGILRLENAKTRSIGYANGLPHQVVTYLFEDREGNIWIGTLNGIAKLNSLAIKNYPSLFPKVTSSIYKILKDDRGINVFTNEGVSIYNFKDETFTSVSFNFSNQNRVNDAIELSANAKLIATNNGLFILQGNRLSYSSLNSQISTKEILSLAKGEDDKLYVGTDSGLFVFRGNKLMDFLSIENVLPGNVVKAILVTKSEDIFIGTDNGLVKYSDDSYLVLRTVNGLINNYINSLSNDSDGKIWIATKKGLSSFKNGRFNNFVLKLGGYIIDEVNDVIPVRENEIWVGTSKGIFIIKNGVNYSSLTTKDGLLSDFITDLEYDNQNKIVFVGTNSGLTTIDLKYFRENNFSYHIYFTGFSTNKKSYDLNQIKVSEDEDVIRVNVSIFSFFDEKKIIYRYRIPEFGENWNYLTNSNQIVYKNLSPGKYTLVVEASVDGVNWLKDSAKLNFEVQSGFLKNLIFYGSVLIGLVFLYSVFAFVRSSVKKKKMKQSQGLITEVEMDSTVDQNINQETSEGISIQNDELDELRKKLEDKIDSLIKIIFEKDKIINQLRKENDLLKEKILELENSIKEGVEIDDEENDFVEKSRIEIIVKNSHEAEEIKRYIEALEKTNWSIRAAAKLLNIPHSTFHYRLKKLNLLKK
jgi:ligand-binding sensor domain-containing protein